MKFHPNTLFHIYNQGNNKRKIFLREENYRYFLWKMCAYLLPFGDIIAWCLMPNHYHWLFYVRQVAIQRKVIRRHVDQIEQLRRIQKYGAKAQLVDNQSNREADENSLIELNEAIGSLQQGYANAINVQEEWSGSLFRKKAKAKDGWIDEFITLQHKNRLDEHRFHVGNDYAYQCLCYIHNNPVKANLVEKSTDYLWSSARDYAGLRKSSICNLELGAELCSFI